MKLIIGNWKMNPQSQKEASELFDAAKEGARGVKSAKVVVCPSSVYLSNLAQSRGELSLGAQNVSSEENGAFTGQVSAGQLKDLGIEYVIIGHSEVRDYLGETDEIISKKIKTVLGAGLKPILCVGEKEGEDKKEVLKKQLKVGLKEILNSKSYVLNLIVAYEPVWAIGTNKNCSVKETVQSILFIRKIIAGLYNKRAAQQIKIIYGGSVNGKNASDYFFEEKEIDGLLVGGASLDAEEFTKIIKSAG